MKSKNRLELKSNSQAPTLAMPLSKTKIQVRKMKAPVNIAKTNENRHPIFGNLTTAICIIKPAGNFA